MDSVRGSRARSMENLKSWAVTGLPSWNLTSFLRWKVKVRSSLLRSHLVAMSGTMLRSASMVTRPLKTSMTTKAELVSEVRAGSRVGGSEKSRVNSPPVPTGESGTDVAVASVAGAVGTGVEVG